MNCSTIKKAVYFGLLFLFLNESVIAGIHEKDDRVYARFASAQQQELAKSIATIIPHYKLRAQSRGYYKIDAVPLEEKRPLCSEGQKFSKDLSFSHCTATLLTEKYVVTSGHCIENFYHDRISERSNSRLKNQRIVFNVKSDNQLISEDDIYSIKYVHEFVFVQGILDYAILELDRKVSFNPSIRMHKGEQAIDSVFSMGHSEGTNLKFLGNTRNLKVRSFFVHSDLDAFEGDSGSPVFETNSGALVGIINAGPKDYVFDGTRNCFEYHRIGQGKALTRFIKLSKILRERTKFENFYLEFHALLNYHHRYLRFKKGKADPILVERAREESVNFKKIDYFLGDLLHEEPNFDLSLFIETSQKAGHKGLYQFITSFE